MPPRRLIVLAVLPLLLAACGSSTSKKQSQADVVSAANGICRQAQAEVDSFVQGKIAPSGEQEILADLAKDVAVAEAAATKLDALHPPDTQKADFDQFVGGVHHIALGDRRFISAIRSNDTPAIKSASAVGVNGAGEAKKGADAYGLRDCPYNPVSVALARKTEALAKQIAASRDPIGSWSGKVTQVGANGKRYHYTALMTVRDVNTVGARAGTIRYPAFPCGGTLTLLAQSKNRFVFRENITAGRQRCPTGGQITSIVTSGRMAWHWARANLTVDGTLIRG